MPITIDKRLRFPSLLLLFIFANKFAYFVLPIRPIQFYLPPGHYLSNIIKNFIKSLFEIHLLYAVGLPE